MIERKPYVPRAYQPLGTGFMLEHDRCALWAGVGLGKSVMTLNVIDTRLIAGYTSAPTLVLGPLRVARDVWPMEVQKWQHLRDMRVVPIVGDVKQRLWALKQDAPVFTINYENIPWLIETLGSRWPFETVIADEATRLKGFRLTQGGVRAQALSKMAWGKVKYWINLTGTPVPNGLKDLWGQTWFLDRGKRLGLTYTSFMERWFKKGYDDVIRPLPHADKEIHERLKDICLTLDPKDWFDLREPVVTDIKVRLPEKAMSHYKELEQQMFTKLACGTEVELFNAAAMTNACRQAANGFIYTDRKRTAAPLHTVKIEALESLVEEIGVPFLLAYHFVEDKDMILRAFPKAALLSEKDGMAAFRAGNAQIGLASAQSVGHGIDGLQDICHHVVFYGHDWNWENRDQFIGRIGEVRQMQSGFDRSVFIYNIVAEDTVDEDILERHVSKQSVQSALLAAMKRKGMARATAEA